MYFPYLRGKQYELLALRESISFIKREKIVPIIEPVRSNTASLKTAITALFKAEIQLQVILNPEVGDFKPNNTGLMEFVDGLIQAGVSNIIPTFLVSNDNDFLRVRTIIEERGYSNFGFSLIHVNKVNDLDQLKEFTDHTNCRLKNDNFWYKYIYPKNLTLFDKEKLVAPEISLGGNFSYDQKGHLIMVTILMMLLLTMLTLKK